MDGGGRLARSLRSLRPQADLKAAAIGAVVLLRERLGSRRAPARPFLQRERPHRLITLLERYLPYRAGVVATILMLLATASLGVVKGGHLDEFISALSDTRNGIANSAGFRITSVAIHGRNFRRRAALEPAAQGWSRRPLAGKRRRQRAGGVEQARQGRQAVLPRYCRRRHASAGPADGAAIGRRSQDPRRIVQGQEAEEEGR